jgi:hypothetical protein
MIFVKTVVVILAFSAVASVAPADDSQNKSQCHEVFHACHEAHRPNFTAGERPSKEQMEAVRSAMESCVSEKTTAAGITCERPERREGHGPRFKGGQPPAGEKPPEGAFINQ